MSRFFAFLCLLTFITACNPNMEQANTKINPDHPVQVDLADSPAWEKDGLRLVPVTASAEWVADQAPVASYKVLSEALEIESFRITEKKPFGRFEDDGAVNNLTVQNKTDETVFLMAGEVVQGGNQDRVLAENIIIPPASIQDIEVFCVEQGRWTYEGDHAINEGDKKAFAFRGYYNVAPAAIRRSVSAGNQQSVWDQVAKVRTTFGADESTTSFADLESSSDFVNKRNDLQLFFKDKLTDNQEIIGFIALKGDKIIGADVFGHPELLNNQFDALLAGYITDVLTESATKEISEERLERFATGFILDMDKKGFSHEGKMIHHSSVQ